jgi:hypothetical protein
MVQRSDSVSRRGVPSSANVGTSNREIAIIQVVFVVVVLPQCCYKSAGLNNVYGIVRLYPQICDNIVAFRTTMIKMTLDQLLI